MSADTNKFSIDNQNPYLRQKIDFSERNIQEKPEKENNLFCNESDYDNFTEEYNRVKDYEESNVFNFECENDYTIGDNKDSENLFA